MDSAGGTASGAGGKERQRERGLCAVGATLTVSVGMSVCVSEVAIKNVCCPQGVRGVA